MDTMKDDMEMKRQMKSIYTRGNMLIERGLTNTMTLKKNCSSNIMILE